MVSRKKDRKLSLGEKDELVEWTDEMFDRAQISIGDKVIREATGTLTKSWVPGSAEKPVKRRKRLKKVDSGSNPE